MKKFIASFLAFLTLALSLNLGFAYHFCGGKLAQTKILGYGKAGCGMENTECKNHSSSSINTIPCCEDKFQKITTDNYWSPLKNHSNIIAGFVPIIPLDFSFPENKLFNVVFYKPPPNLTSVFLPFIKVLLI